MMEVNMSKILCPVDFSDSSEYAAGYALAFARVHQAQLLLLHVMPPPMYAVPDYTGIYEFTPQDIEQFEEQVRRRLGQFAEGLKAEADAVSTRLVSGVPFVEILGVAKEQGADLIVMGTHGRTGLPHMLIGSVAEKVVRKAPCPVLTVRHPEHEFEMP